MKSGLTVHVHLMATGVPYTATFSHDDVRVTIGHHTAAVPHAVWDQARALILADFAANWRTAYGRTALGEILRTVTMDPPAFVALHAFAPPAGDASAVATHIGGELADQLRDRVFVDGRGASMFVPGALSTIDAKAAPMLYRLGRLGRLTYEGTGDVDVWSTWFVPIHANAFAVGGLPAAADALAARLDAQLAAARVAGRITALDVPAIAADRP